MHIKKIAKKPKQPPILLIDSQGINYQNDQRQIKCQQVEKQVTPSFKSDEKIVFDLNLNPLKSKSKSFVKVASDDMLRLNKQQGNERNQNTSVSLYKNSCQQYAKNYQAPNKIQTKQNLADKLPKVQKNSNQLFNKFIKQIKYKKNPNSSALLKVRKEIQEKFQILKIKKVSKKAKLNDKSKESTIKNLQTMITILLLDKSKGLEEGGNQQLHTNIKQLMKRIQEQMNLYEVQSLKSQKTISQLKSQVNFYQKMCKQLNEENRNTQNEVKEIKQDYKLTQNKLHRTQTKAISQIKKLKKIILQLKKRLSEKKYNFNRIQLSNYKKRTSLQMKQMNRKIKVLCSQKENLSQIISQEKLKLRNVSSAKLTKRKKLYPPLRPFQRGERRKSLSCSNIKSKYIIPTSFSKQNYIPINLQKQFQIPAKFSQNGNFQPNGFKKMKIKIRRPQNAKSKSFSSIIPNTNWRYQKIKISTTLSSSHKRTKSFKSYLIDNLFKQLKKNSTLSDQQILAKQFNILEKQQNENMKKENPKNLNKTDMQKQKQLNDIKNQIALINNKLLYQTDIFKANNDRLLVIYYS